MRKTRSNLFYSKRCIVFTRENWRLAHALPQRRCSCERGWGLLAPEVTVGMGVRPDREGWGRAGRVR